MDMQTINSVMKRKEFNVSFDSIKMILWHNIWQQTALVAQRLVQGLQTNGAAMAVEDTLY